MGWSIMKPQDTVALILTVGVILMLMSGTSLKYAFIDPVDWSTLPVSTDASIAFWKDVVLVILGALSGYISGKGNKP